MLALVLELADKPADVGSGAVLTLVLPLGIAIIVLAVWYLSLRRSQSGD